jgi:hypothetical protein
MPENKNGIIHCGGFVVGSEEMSKANETRQFIEKQDEGLIDLILSGEPRQEPCFELKNIHCPLCQGDTIQITETAEGDSERVFFQMKCLDCGCEFVLFEDFIDACRRGIKNAKNDIEYSKNKIEYFESKLGGSS